MSKPLPGGDTEPWYRQFWPWFIFLLPATAAATRRRSSSSLPAPSAKGSVSVPSIYLGLRIMIPLHAGAVTQSHGKNCKISGKCHNGTSLDQSQMGEFGSPPNALSWMTLIILVWLQKRRRGTTLIVIQVWGL